MSDLTISSAAELTSSTIADVDLIPVLDVSATSGSKGSKITTQELTAKVNSVLRAESNVFTASGAASTPAMSHTGSLFTGGTSSTTKPHFLIEPTGTTSTGWSTNGTLIGANAPTGFAGKLIDTQLNGTSFTYIDPNGLYIGMPGMSGWTARIASNWGNLACWGYYQTYLGGYSPSLRALGGSGEIVWFSLANENEASVMALREGTAAHTFRIYGTSTDASNYERLSFITTAGAYSIKPEAAGTGTLRSLHISGLPTSNPGPGILWNNAGTPAIGT